MLHVSSYLMGASCLQSTLHQGGIAIALQHFVMGDSTLANVRARREYRHALTILGVATYIAFYTSCVLRKVTPYQCLIAAVGVVIEELGTQLCLRFWCLGDDKQSTGILVNAVYQSHAGVVGVV